jgi:hypothetical protein
LGKEQEHMRHIIRNFFEKPDTFGDIEVKTELGKVDYVFTCHYRGNICVNLVEVKTPSEVRGKSTIDQAIRELLYYSAAIHFHDDYKHCKYHREYVALDEASIKEISMKMKNLQEKLKRYRFGLLITDLRTGKATVKLPAKFEKYI